MLNSILFILGGFILMIGIKLLAKWIKEKRFKRKRNTMYRRSRA